MKSLYIPISLTTNGYLVTLCSQILFIAADIASNEILQWSELREYHIAMVIVFCVQDVVLLLAAMVLGHTMFRTHVFKAGFVRILLDRFKFAVIFTLLYLAITIVYQIVVISTRWTNILGHNWPTGFTVLFVSHRMIAILYYYYYKRAALRLSDARYYDEEWVKHSFAH